MPPSQVFRIVPRVLNSAPTTAKERAAGGCPDQLINLEPPRREGGSFLARFLASCERSACASFTPIFTAAGRLPDEARAHPLARLSRLPDRRRHAVLRRPASGPSF